MAGKRHDDGGLCLCDRPDGTCAGLAVRRLSQDRVRELAEEIWTASSGNLPPGRPGGAGRLLPFADLGQQGRRYVTDVITPELIEEVMGEPAVAPPIRTYVGFNSQPLYQTGRPELALADAPKQATVANPERRRRSASSKG
jgi:uncharacterized membrane protein